jgi:hypothetical protein
MYNRLMLLAAVVCLPLWKITLPVVPPSRLAALARGIRVPPGLSEADFDQLARTGFTNVEVPDVISARRGLAAELTVTVSPTVATELGRIDPAWAFVRVASVDELAAARKAWPDATLLVTWDGESEIPDSSVVGIIELAEPEAFLRQGSRGWEDVSSVPYPSSPVAVVQVLSAAKDEHKDAVYRYGRERWDRDRIRRTLQKSLLVAYRLRLPVIVSGFAISNRAPSDGRAKYLADLASILRETRVGWQLSAYLEPTGPFRGSAGSRRLDDVWMQAVGLAKN